MRQTAAGPASSSSEDGDRVAVRGYAVTHPPGPVVLPQTTGWDQLLFASRGVMTVLTAAGTWVVPPHRAVWVPSGVEHRIVNHGRTSVRTLYFAAGLAPLPAECRAVNVPPLLRELILHTMRLCPLELRREEHRRLVGVLLDQLALLPTEPLQLPLPLDQRAAAVAAMLIEDPGLTTGLEPLAAEVGASRRTIERLFRAETAMTFAQWRQRLRLVRALQLLAAGLSVTTVAARVGYSTPSAFTAMFRTELGTTPRRYFAVGQDWT